MTGLQRLAIKILYDDFECWLDANLELVLRDGQRAGWFVPNLDPAKRHQLEQWIEESTATTGILHRRISDIVCRARWPITISCLHENLPDVTEPR